MNYNDPIWKSAFSILLKRIISTYKLDYNQYCEEYNVTPSAFRYWLIGSRLPQLQNLEDIQKFILNNISDTDRKGTIIRQDILEFISKQGFESYAIQLNCIYKDTPSFIVEALLFYYNAAKHKIERESSFILPTNRIKAVVFDFDGTLAKNKSNRTIWESLWVCSGYSERDCQLLHQKFNNKEIDHAKWCELTEKVFKDGGLHRDAIKKIAKKIHLIPGVKQVFSELRNCDIKIYIVSGSILYVIQDVLGSYNCYVDRIQANIFTYTEEGYLDKIIVTRYDFLGKSQFIREIARELTISPKDILFVGNSINDQFAYQSGARTLCINPILTDPYNRTIWNNYIPFCNNLCEILPFIFEKKCDDL